MQPIEEMINQPDVYPFSAFLARRYGCKWIIEVGCGKASKLVELYPEFEIVGIDSGLNQKFCLDEYKFGYWINWDIDGEAPPEISDEILNDAIIICSGVIEHLNDPDRLLKILSKWMEYVSLCVITTPDRDQNRGENDSGSPVNPSHVHEWNMKEFETLLMTHGFSIPFLGLTANNSRDREKKTLLAIIHNKFFPIPSPKSHAPEEFRVIALIPTYNEEDVIIPTIHHLANEGILFYIIDNWSTDQTYEIIKNYSGQNLAGHERFPSNGPISSFEVKNFLQREIELAQHLEGDWFIHYDADEIRRSPWEGVSLREAIYMVDQMGFNAIDHTVIDFHPIDNGFVSGMDPEAYFRYFEFGHRPGHFLQIKAWKKEDAVLELAESGGHEIRFNDRKVFPYNFLLKHYPIRSQQHGIKKVFQERIPRYSRNEVALGWHTQYRNLSKEHNFIRSPENLYLFDINTFYRNYLVERLSRIGIESLYSSTNDSNDSQIIDEKSYVYREPNKFTRPTYIAEYENSVAIHGYQEFSLTQKSIQVHENDVSLRVKQELLTSFFSPGVLTSRSLLDLGASNGFFGFWALQNDASESIALDIDPNCLQIINKCRTKFGFDRLRVLEADVSKWQEPADIVLALALVHWIYSCTALFGSLDAILEKLASLTNYLLIIEWVDPQDQAIQSFHHLDWNKENISGPYTLEAFENALNHYFVRRKFIGQITSTRRLYAAYKSYEEIDHTCPLPSVFPEDSLISSRKLVTHNQIDYWSRVYDLGNLILKQTTGELASREAFILSKLCSPYFPKPIEYKLYPEWSSISQEKIKGIPVMEAESELTSSPSRFHSFIQDCLNILVELELAHIQHRDIRIENLLIKDDKPVLIDFGWAISPEHPCFTPAGLAHLVRPPDGSYSDLYSMGVILDQINRHRYPEFDKIISMIIAAEAQFRITDLKILKYLFSSQNSKLSSKESAIN